MDAKTIHDAKSFIRSFRAVIAFAEIIEQIGTVETDMNNVRLQYEELMKDLHSAEHKLQEAYAERDGVKAEVAAARQAAEDDAKSIRENAMVAARRTIAKADEKAAVAFETSKNEAKMWDAKLAQLSADCETKKAELVEVEKQLALAKEQLNKLFEGLSDGRIRQV